MQHKRKRQYIMDIEHGGDDSARGVTLGGGEDGGSLFAECVHKLEHARWEAHDQKYRYTGPRSCPCQAILMPLCSNMYKAQEVQGWLCLCLWATRSILWRV